MLLKHEASVAAMYLSSDAALLLLLLPNWKYSTLCYEDMNEYF